MNIVRMGESSPHIENEPKEDKIVIVDCDSLLHQCAHPGKDEYGNTLEEYTEDQYPLAEAKLNERILSVLNIISLRYNIIEYYLCIKGKNNFRYEVYPEYKANRPSPIPIINHLGNFVVDTFNAITSDGAEADDYCFTLSEEINHKGIIAACDKDLKQIPGIHYNYNTEEWCEISEELANYNLAMQILIGDTSDNVKINHGLGPVKASKIIFLGMSKYQYIKSIYQAYKKYNGDEVKNKLKTIYKILKLRNMKEK